MSNTFVDCKGLKKWFVNLETITTATSDRSTYNKGQSNTTYKLGGNINNSNGCSIC